MTPRAWSMLLGGSLAVLAGAGLAQTQRDPLAPLAPEPVAKRVVTPPPVIRAAPIRTQAPAPAALRSQIASLGRNFDGLAGISVLSTA